VGVKEHLFLMPIILRSLVLLCAFRGAESRAVNRCVQLPNWQSAMANGLAGTARPLSHLRLSCFSARIFWLRRSDPASLPTLRLRRIAFLINGGYDFDVWTFGCARKAALPRISYNDAPYFGGLGPGSPMGKSLVNVPTAVSFPMVKWPSFSIFVAIR